MVFFYHFNAPPCIFSRGVLQRGSHDVLAGKRPFAINMLSCEDMRKGKHNELQNVPKRENMLGKKVRREKKTGNGKGIIVSR